MSSSMFDFIQYGKETVHGTSVAATKNWPGQAAKIGTDSKKTFVEEMTNSRAKARRSTVDQLLYKNTLQTARATFQQVPVILGCGLKAATAGAESTSGQADYPWAWVPSMTSTLNAPDSLTIELGDDTQEWESEYCMFEKISFAGNIGQDGADAAISLNADFFGRQLAPSTKTGSLAQPSGNFMNAKLARLYIDTSWAGLGGTELADLLRGFTIDIMTGLHPDATGAAANYFNKHKEGYIDVMATFTIEAGSVANAILAAHKVAGLASVFARLEITGPQIGSGLYHKLTFDIAGQYDEPDPINSEDRGDNLATFSVHGVLDDTSGKMININEITNSNAY